MRKFLVKAQFDGVNYNGYQKNKGNTIQETIERAISQVFGTTIEIDGCSRTDAGVSARVYYFCFCIDTKLPADRVAYKINKYLPKSISCLSSSEVSLDYMIRKNVLSKTYRYNFYDGDINYPLLAKRYYWAKQSVNINNMIDASQYLVGKHNYKSFVSRDADAVSTVRTINYINIGSLGDGYYIDINGDGFLYNMVRIIAGTLIDVGLGRIDVDQVRHILNDKDRQSAGPTLNPRFLQLYDVELKK